VNKAEITRIIELDRAARGLPTTRPVKEMLAAERRVAKRYPVTPIITGTGVTTEETPAPQA
jgi:hydroxyethylthiazole kinase-like sugar kinase family protein